jgi:hypothetical protein
MGCGMDMKRIELEAKNFFCVDLIDHYTFLDMLKFSEHIYKLTRQETIYEVKAAMDKMQ